MHHHINLHYFTSFCFKNIPCLITTLLIILFIESVTFASNSSDDYPKNLFTDITQYTFAISLSDESDSIFCHTTIEGIIKQKEVNSFIFDLANVTDAREGKGMIIDSIQLSSKHKLQSFKHKEDKINIVLESSLIPGERFTLNIFYKGIPYDGLIISANKYGDRTFFGDNWPNRAHHWLACVDHPYDKAKCTFIVKTPNHYEVIASGSKKEESFLNPQFKITKWESETDLATKVMVIGVAKFAIQYLDPVNGTPIESWVFPQNKKEGFYDYALASQVFDFFDRKIGPFSYEKLANVQSKTKYGGMENAGNIFYYENSVTGERKIEQLFAHEIAHQWFGDAITEADWHHLWLSEGFATYFTNLYIENTHGRDSMNSLLETQKTNILSYYQEIPTSSIIDFNITNLNKLLNTNTYQKGAWVLHMLRKQIGTDTFWKAIRAYYKAYQDKNALTQDFQFVIEDYSNQDLEWFFEQWLYRPGVPVLNTQWKYSRKNQVLAFNIEQTQPEEAFRLPLTLEFIYKDGTKERKVIEITQRMETFEIPIENKPVLIVTDPDLWLLAYFN